MKKFDIDIVAALCSFEESGYCCGDDHYSAPSMYAQAELEGCRAYKFPLAYFDFTNCPWSHTERVADMVYHMRRAMNSDTSIPIIISPVGTIIDGYHRVVKAVLDGDEYVLAYRLKELPDPD